EGRGSLGEPVITSIEPSERALGLVKIHGDRLGGFSPTVVLVNGEAVGSFETKGGEKQFFVPIYSTDGTRRVGPEMKVTVQGYYSEASATYHMKDDLLPEVPEVVIRIEHEN